MDREKILKTLSNIGAVITNSHIVYTSGKHGSVYINKDAIYPHTSLTSDLCLEMAKEFKDRDIDVVAGPTIGGVILSQWVAYHLSQLLNKEVFSIFSEENDEKKRFFKRGYDKLIPEKNILIVEDILTTGGSVKKVVDAVRKLKGSVVGCAALCNRGAVSAEELDVPELKALLNIDLESWKESDCPMCKSGVSVNTSVGKGREYLKNS